MKETDGTKISWEASVGIAVFFLIVSESFIGVVFFKQYSLGPISSFSRLTSLLGLAAAAIVIPVPLLSVLDIKRKIQPLHLSADLNQELPPVFQRWLGSLLIVTYVTIQSLVLALTHLTHP